MKTHLIETHLIESLNFICFLSNAWRRSVFILIWCKSHLWWEDSCNQPLQRPKIHKHSLEVDKPEKRRRRPQNCGKRGSILQLSLPAALSFYSSVSANHALLRWVAVVLCTNFHSFNFHSAQNVKLFVCFRALKSSANMLPALFGAWSRAGGGGVQHYHSYYTICCCMVGRNYKPYVVLSLHPFL